MTLESSHCLEREVFWSYESIQELPSFPKRYLVSLIVQTRPVDGEVSVRRTRKLCEACTVGVLDFPPRRKPACSVIIGLDRVPEDDSALQVCGVDAVVVGDFAGELREGGGCLRREVTQAH